MTDRDLPSPESLRRERFVRVLEREMDGVRQAAAVQLSRGWWGTVDQPIIFRPLTWRDRLSIAVARFRFACASPLQWLADRIRGYELREEWDE